MQLEQPTTLEIAERLLDAAATIREAVHIPGNVEAVTDANGNPITDLYDYAAHLNGQGIGYALVSIAGSLAALLEAMEHPAVIYQDDPMEGAFNGTPEANPT